MQKVGRDRGRGRRGTRGWESDVQGICLASEGAGRATRVPPSRKWRAGGTMGKLRVKHGAPRARS
eukprot:9230387-Alexandrium_andersonii.AAC.1